MFSATWAGRLAPGMAHVTAGFQDPTQGQLRQGGALGSERTHCSTARRPVLKSTPANVSPRSNSSPWRLKFRWSSLANRLARVILPDNRPEASGTRARMPTRRRCGLREKQVRRALPEDVENNLKSSARRELDGLERLLDLLDACSIMPQLAGLHEVVEDAEHFRPIKNRGRGQCSCSKSIASVRRFLRLRSTKAVRLERL